jgi:hypothetical protein
MGRMRGWSPNKKKLINGTEIEGLFENAAGLSGTVGKGVIIFFLIFRAFSCILRSRRQERRAGSRISWNDPQGKRRFKWQKIT